MRAREILPAIATGAIVGVVLALPLLAAGLEDEAPPRRPDPAIQLFVDHECWVDDGLTHPMPAGALATLPGEEPRIHAAEVGYGIWLEGDPGQLHAFCKEGPR